MNNDVYNTWSPTLTDPSQTRQEKPRQSGLSMIIDKGIGRTQFSDMIEAGAPYMDYIKLGFGTSALYPPAIMHTKLVACQQANTTLYPGGTFFEIAYSQKKEDEYFQRLQEIGFDTVEISDGTIHLDCNERRAVIRKAVNMGFTVITECGKKQSGSTLDLEQIRQTLESDLECGASIMIVEGRESGKNVGIYDHNGAVDSLFFEQVADVLQSEIDKVMWEAPQKEQQVRFIQHLGTNANLGNIHPQDIYSVECLRRGLRSDTFCSPSVPYVSTEN